MNTALLEIIPSDRLANVLNALRITFDNAIISNICLLTGYSTSKTYKIVVNNKAFVLRVMGLDQDLSDRQNQITCLSIASKLDIAPACFYADAIAGIVIMDYIEPIQFQDKKDWLEKVAEILQRLHCDNTFPSTHEPLFTYLDGLSASLLKYPLCSHLANYLKKIAEIQHTLSSHLMAVSCHNDLNSTNILFDGKKPYLIDWEAAGLCDPFFDIAMICNQSIFSKEEETYFLLSYFGNVLTDYQNAKLFLMKQIAYCYPALHFLNFAAEAGLSLADEHMLNAIPSLASWSSSFKAGDYQLNSPTDFLFYAAVQINESLAQIASEEFKTAHADIVL